MRNPKIVHNIVINALALGLLAAAAGAQTAAPAENAAGQNAFERQKARIDADLSAAEKGVAEVRELKVRRMKSPESGPAVKSCEAGSLVEAVKSARAMGVGPELARTEGLGKGLADYLSCQGAVIQSVGPCSELGTELWSGSLEECRDKVVMSLAAKAMVSRDPAVGRAVCSIKGLPAGLSGGRCAAWARGAAAGESVSRICADMAAAGGNSSQNADCDSLTWIAGLAPESECRAMRSPTERSLCRAYAAYRKAASAGAAACGRQTLCQALVTGNPNVCERESASLKTQVCSATLLLTELKTKSADLDARFQRVSQLVGGFEPKSDPWYALAQQRLKKLSKEYSAVTSGQPSRPGGARPPR